MPGPGRGAWERGGEGSAESNQKADQMRTLCLYIPTLAVLAVPAGAAAPKEAPRAREVDAAVRKALGFLKATQNADGTWPAGPSARSATAGLAVMAFLSAGHVPGEGPYGKAVE